MNLEEFAPNGVFVLPIFEKEGRDYILCGRETQKWDHGTYDSFGGKVDKSDRDVLDSATREFDEEAFGSDCLGLSREQIRNHIQENTGQIIAVQDDRKKNVLYMTRFSEEQIRDILHNFGPVYNETEYVHENGYHEKDRLATVAVSDIYQALCSELEVVPAQIYTLDGRNYFDYVRLRPILIKLLKPHCLNYPVAQKLQPAERNISLYKI